jgi:hypothetical protein
MRGEPPVCGSHAKAAFTAAPVKRVRELFGRGSVERATTAGFYAMLGMTLDRL